MYYLNHKVLAGKLLFAIFKGFLGVACGVKLSAQKPICRALAAARQTNDTYDGSKTIDQPDKLGMAENMSVSIT